MKGTRTVVLAVLAATLAAAVALADDPAKRREKIDQTAKTTLEVLFATLPAAKTQQEKAYGYAVFDIRLESGDVNFASEHGGGEGVAVHGADRIYMQATASRDTQVKGYQVVFLFESQAAFDTFTQGFEFGDAKKTAQAAGVAVDSGFVSGVKVYQVYMGKPTATASVSNTWYKPDKKLNDK